MAKVSGQDYGDPNLLYFGKPDVNHQEGFKLAVGVAVTFQVYVDNKGAGAYEVSPASLLTPADVVLAVRSDGAGVSVVTRPRVP